MSEKSLRTVLVLLVFLLFLGSFSHAQVTLTSSPYTQNFNTLGAGLPAGWTVRTGATATVLGAAVTPVTTPGTTTAWRATNGNFRNVASGTGLASSMSATDQNAVADRALAVRQTGSFGDPGAAFVLQLANTHGLSNITMSFKLQSLDDSNAPRTATWRVDYGVGATPTSFTTITTTPANPTTGGNAFTDNTVTLDFGSALDNISDNVWIRIVALSASTGSGNRPTTAIDDVSLSFVVGDITPPTFSYSYPKLSEFTTSGAKLSASLNEAGKVYYIIQDDGAPAPNATQIRNGQDGSGTPRPTGFYGTLDITAADTEFSTVISSLSDGTDYDLYLVAQDGEDNLQNSPDGLDLRTNTAGDVTPPAFHIDYPKTTSITATSFFLYSSIDEWGTIYYIILPKDAPAPTSAQVKAGTDASNTSLAENLTGSVINRGNSELMSKIEDLSSSTAYDIYVVAEDNIPNLMAAPVKLTLTTLDQFTENFNSCNGTASFISYSVVGDQVWACNDFGYNGSKGLRMNGFGSAAVANEDWLVSPSMILSANAELSFYSQFSFAGNSLQLKISTDYTGTGNPALATWTDLDGQFPTVAVGSTSTALSDWTHSEVDLSAYGGQKVYIAFVYSSTTAGAARWTIDEVNVSGALASYMTTSSASLQFLAAGVVKDYTIAAVNLTSNVVVTAPEHFLLSKDNSTFSSTLTFTPAELNTAKTVHVKFDVATVSTETFTGTITHTSEGVYTKEVAVKGTDKSQTLDVVAYNLEFFGTDVKDASNVEFGPTDDALQVANVTTVMQTLGADIYSVEEVSDDNAFNQLVSNLPGYDKILADRWSYSFNPPEPTFPPQKIGFIYDKSTIKIVSSRVMFASMYDGIRAGTVTLPSYPGESSSSFWSSGRLPFMLTADVTIKDVKRRVHFIVIHAKSGSAQDDYDRRKYDIQVLHDSLTAHYANKNVIIMGDFNDDVDTSIKAGSESTYKVFVDDSNFNMLTYSLSQAGGYTFPSSSSFLDHIMISGQFVPAYVPGSIAVEDPRGFISGYTSNTSDHLPVSARFQIANKLDQTVTFDPLADKTIGDAPFSLTATSNAAVALNVSFTASSDKITISGSQVTLAKAGRVSITASQPGNEDYNAATPVVQSFCIKPAKPAITVANDGSASPILTSSAAQGNQWYLNDAAISGALSNSYTATTAGVYKVRVTADDCVSEYSDNTPVIVTAIEPSEAAIIAYPNPAADYLVLQGLDATASEVQVVDMTGRGTVLKLEYISTAHRANVSTLKAGLYIARIQKGNKIAQVKFIKR